MTEVFALLSAQLCCFFTCAGSAAVDQEAGGIVALLAAGVEPHCQPRARRVLVFTAAL